MGAWDGPLERDQDAFGDSESHTIPGLIPLIFRHFPPIHLQSRQPRAYPVLGMSQKSISARKLAANQANARKSIGPRTEAGKQRSSQNSFKHGLYAADTVLSTDDPELYYAFSVEWYRLYPPRDFEELSILSDMIATRWRFLRHCGRVNRLWGKE